MNEEQILEMLENREYKELKIELEKMYPVDLAELLEEFDEKQRIIVFRLLSKESAADTFTYLNSRHARSAYQRFDRFGDQRSDGRDVSG